MVIASNGDAEAVEAYRHTLDAAGFEGDYIVQSFGTSELGGKLMAEGENLEADIVTMSSYYVDSAQTEQDMFVPLTELELCPLDPSVPVHGVSQPRGARRARRAQRGEGGRYGLGHSRGLCAGVRSIGVAEGSSVMGLTQAEYEALDSAGQDAACERATRVLREAGAADVVRNLSELPGLLGL